MKAAPEACVKRKYETRKQAKAVRARHHKIGRDGGGLRAYYCESCGAWHLGHLSKMVRGGWKAREEHYGPAAGDAEAVAS